MLEKEERDINIILKLDRFKNNYAMYYAILTAYCTSLRTAEVFALTWDDIDFYKAKDAEISDTQLYRQARE